MKVRENSIIQTLANTSNPSHVVSSRPIGADVLLSSSSSVASEIQEQMSQSVRQKSLFAPQICLPNRPPTSAHTLPLEHSNSAKTVNLPLDYNSPESMSIHHPVNAFKPQKQASSNKSGFIQTPVHVTVSREQLERELHQNIASSSSCISDIKHLPLHSPCNVKLVEGDSFHSNQIIQPISQIRHLQQHSLFLCLQDARFFFPQCHCLRKLFYLQ